MSYQSCAGVIQSHRSNITKTWVVGNKEMTGKSVTGQRCYQLITLMGRVEELMNLKKTFGLSEFVRNLCLLTCFIIK